ncbi:hypothetical protein [Sinomonas atrocyanea]|uniref:hypothetical protein n=1 Tax=Sinomonas atrocyanea TaxID=37927 RepID=UPI0014718663|nr:hypothetical protein [Sinomonas atrocyanea]
MTSAFDPDDLGVVDELLEGLDAEDAESLRPVLSELRGLAESAPVLPNRRLSSLLAAAPQPSAPSSSPRRSTKPGRPRWSTSSPCGAAALPRGAAAAVRPPPR